MQVAGVAERSEADIRGVGTARGLVVVDDEEEGVIAVVDGVCCKDGRAHDK